MREVITFFILESVNKGFLYLGQSTDNPRLQLYVGGPQSRPNFGIVLVC